MGKRENLLRERSPHLSGVLVSIQSHLATHSLVLMLVTIAVIYSRTTIWIWCQWIINNLRQRWWWIMMMMMNHKWRLWLIFTSAILLRSASIGARGKAETKIVMNPNCMIEEFNVSIKNHILVFSYFYIPVRPYLSIFSSNLTPRWFYLEASPVSPSRGTRQKVTSGPKPATCSPVPTFKKT